MRFAIVLLVSISCSFASTVVYDAKTANVKEMIPDAENLWLTLPDLTAASGFVLKPQGACLAELCVPIPKDRSSAFLKTASHIKYFNLSELARTLHQPAVHDVPSATWLFGPRPESQMKYVNTLEAPDFALQDWKGVRRSLSDFRGKKVLLITWASW